MAKGVYKPRSEKIRLPGSPPLADSRMSEDAADCPNDDLYDFIKLVMLRVYMSQNSRVIRSHRKPRNH